MKTNPRRRSGAELPAIELIEEAVHLLRRAPAATHAIYFSATGGYIVALLFFWAYMTWFQPSGEVVAWAALGLVALFTVMKAAHAEFCAQLMALRMGTGIAPWSWRRLSGLALVQLRVQPWALVAWVPAMLLGVPFGWVYAYGQSATVIGESEHLHDDAVQQAKLWPMQNHAALLLLSVVWICAWVNLAAAFYAVPWLANRLLGIDNIFGLSGWAFANTTFLACVTGLTWLAVDPLVKAFYTLRVFHGRARRTGEDVRVELRLAQSRVARAAGVLCLLLVALTPLVPAQPEREGRAAAQGNVQPAQLDAAINTVLAGSEFQWRMRPLPGPQLKPEGPVKRFVRQGVKLLRDSIRWVGRLARNFADWVRQWFPDRQDAAEQRAAATVTEVVRILLYGFIGFALLVIGWLVWLIVRRVRHETGLAVAAQPLAAAAAPDLRDENLHAAQLPADEWLALARGQMARGEWRLALRALYLATLARLAREGFITLAKFKSNLDYERELRRRVWSRAGVVSHFAARRRSFESVWYGRHEPGEDVVREWLAELERPGAP
ncbi:MAG: hypothetical protein Q7S40_28070 [Opitutaceae bacterium]|nr:hypothetical protein [Opitutaceae bacterium]